eukprot:3240626-Rhodomonas_salina.1
MALSFGVTAKFLDTVRCGISMPFMPHWASKVATQKDAQSAQQGVEQARGVGGRKAAGLRTRNPSKRHGADTTCQNRQVIIRAEVVDHLARPRVGDHNLATDIQSGPSKPLVALERKAGCLFPSLQ